MTIVSIVALLISAFAISFGSIRLNTSRLLLMIALLVVHVGSSVYYYQYSKSAITDASSYYFDPYHLAQLPIGLSVVLITQICYFLKSKFGASYLDCFLLFQSVGFMGVMILTRLFQEIEAKIGVPDRRGYLLLLFLPSVNFWTAAIGKDALMFFSVSLCVWSVMEFRRRFVYFCFGLLIMVLFRAHIALMAATAFAATAFFDRHASVGRKTGLLAVAITGILLVVGPVHQTLDVDVTSASSVTQFLNDRNSVYANVGGTTAVANAPYAVRVMSLLFRPFFFDATGMLGLIASVENVGIVAVFVYAILHWRDVNHLSRQVFFIRFNLFYAFIVLFSLTLVYYNVGLGLRERVMTYPMIFSVLVALWSMRQKYSAEGALEGRPALIACDQANRVLAER